MNKFIKSGMSLKLFSTFLFLGVGFFNQASAQDANFQTYRSLFDKNYFKNGIDPVYLTFEKKFQDDTFVSWSYGDRLLSLADMYQATGDDKYAIQALNLIKLAYNNRDDMLGRKDMVRGEIVPAWGESYYSTQRTDSITNSGMIIWPAMKIANLIRQKNTSLYQKNKAFVDDISVWTYQTYKVFLDDFMVTSAKGAQKGYFTPARNYGLPQSCPPNNDADKSKTCDFFRNNSKFPLPFNMSLIIGNYLIERIKWNSEVSGDDFSIKHDSRVVALLLNHFIDDSKLRINPANRNTLIWKYLKDGYYENGAPKQIGRVEDVSHGSVIIKFMTELQKNYDIIEQNAGINMSFRPDDEFMTMMANTFTQNIAKKTRKGWILRYFADGTDDKTRPNTNRCNYWLVLSKYNPQITNICTTIMIRKDAPVLIPQNSNQLSISQLVLNSSGNNQ